MPCLTTGGCGIFATISAALVDGKGVNLRCRHILQSLALRDIEDVIQAQKRDFLHFARFLVRHLHWFPEHDGAGFFALLHAAAKLDGLTEREPVR